MLSLNLIDKSQMLNAPGVKSLKPKELCYIRLESYHSMTAAQLMIIEEAVKHSTEVYLSLPIDELIVPEIRERIYTLGIKGVALRTGYEVKKFLKHERRGPEWSGDLDLIEKVTAIRRETEGKEIVIEIEIQQDMRILAPTIARLYNLGTKWIVLNVEGAPDRMRVQNFREIFEYLRIRSCNYLNIYFPFWSDFFREWDMKTQNTFSGLFEVHIDLSNRCTHNCIFCGLYGPIAVEDMKEKGGGVLRDNVTEFMKMEIETEHCLKIIESLPWSVDLIQFGGAGDPLMHKDAVKFITAARSRGFRVGILSNMEYLEEEDLVELHQLGGRTTHDLHFIANVSAGTHEMYTKTRPRQNEKHFNKIVNNLDRLSTMREQSNNTGVFFTLMCVVTTVNCGSLLDVARLAHRIRADKLWFKPMELHAQFQQPLIPHGDIMKEFARSLKEAIDFAKEKNMKIEQLDYCERIIAQNLEGAVNV